jgi:hypothetical protein
VGVSLDPTESDEIERAQQFMRMDLAERFGMGPSHDESILYSRACEQALSKAPEMNTLVAQKRDFVLAR